MGGRASVMCFLNMVKQHFGCGQTPQVAYVLIHSATFRTASTSLPAQHSSGPVEAPTECSQFSLGAGECYYISL